MQDIKVYSKLKRHDNTEEKILERVKSMKEKPYDEEKELEKAKKASVPPKQKEEFGKPKIILKWKTPEFVYYPKSKNWYIIAGLVLAVLLAYSIWEKSFITAVTFIVLAVIFYMYAERKPQILDIEINDSGILFHDRFFPYENLNGFWITYEPPETKLLTISTKSFLFQKISIILTDQNPVKLRQILLEEIPEDKKLDQGGIDNFAKRIRF